MFGPQVGSALQNSWGLSPFFDQATAKQQFMESMGVHYSIRLSISENRREKRMQSIGGNLYNLLLYLENTKKKNVNKPFNTYILYLFNH